MRVFIVTDYAEMIDAKRSETYVFTDYEEAYTKYRELIDRELQNENSWVHDLAFDEDGYPVDYERYDCSYDDNNSNESDVYWYIEDIDESPCYIDVQLNGRDIELPKCTLNTQDLWQLCNDKKWFTNGDNYQYERMFRANEEDCPLDELAAIIWICSDKQWTRAQIKDEIICRQICGRIQL